jgi:hypothetical protein
MRSLRTWLLCACIATLAGLAACAKGQARTSPERPPLQVPAPPPRLVEPLPSAPIEAQPGDDLPPTAPQRSSPRPARPSGRGETAPKADAPRPEEIKPPEPVEEARPQGQQAAPLRMENSDDVAAERKVREVLSRASRDLGRVNYGALNTDARAQYDTAKRFVEQADEAVKARNFVFATYLADKAETIARALLNR